MSFCNFHFIIFRTLFVRQNNFLPKSRIIKTLVAYFSRQNDTRALFPISHQEQVYITVIFIRTGGLGWIQDFTEGGSIVGPLKALPCRGVRGHPRKFKSSEMRFPTFWGQVVVFWGLVFLSQNVILINILQFLWRQRFQFRGFDGTPESPLHPPQKGLSLTTYFLIF